jgi:uncharacterized protein (DUF983 family)
MQLIAGTSRRNDSSAGNECCQRLDRYTARDVRDYLLTVSRRFARWIIAALVAVPFYAVMVLAGLPEWVGLIAAFIGAVIGSLLAIRLIERLFGPEPRPEPPPPRGRGTGKRGA